MAEKGEKKEWKVLGVEYKLEKPVEETVLYDKVTPEIARISFNRPEKHNALYVPDQADEIKKKLQMPIHDEDVKVVIIRGNGPSFCTGDDLNRAPFEAMGGRPGVAPPQARRLIGFHLWEAELMRDFLYHPKVLISEVNGWCVGVGLMMALCCDLVVAAEDAKFSHYEQRISFAGLDPCVMQLEFLHFGPKKAREWGLSGRTLSAQEAKEWGMVNSIVPRDKLEDEAMRWAKMVALQANDGLVNANMYRSLCYEAMGMGTGMIAGGISHTLMTNLRWRPDEFNFLKIKSREGASKAFAEREKRWGELGF